MGPLAPGAMAATSLDSAVSPDAASTQVGYSEVCAVFAIGTGVAGRAKALAKGASWYGIAATIGCYAWDKAVSVPDAQRRAAAVSSYNRYMAMSELKKLDALGYSCTKYNPGGGGGTDAVAAVGWTFLTMKGVKYRCSARD